MVYLYWGPVRKLILRRTLRNLTFKGGWTWGILNLRFIPYHPSKSCYVPFKAYANEPNISPTFRQHLTNNVGDQHVGPVCAGKNVGQMLANCWPTILNWFNIVGQQLANICPTLLLWRQDVVLPPFFNIWRQIRVWQYNVGEMLARCWWRQRKRDQQCWPTCWRDVGEMLGPFAQALSSTCEATQTLK